MYFDVFNLVNWLIILGLLLISTVVYALNTRDKLKIERLLGDKYLSRALNAEKKIKELEDSFKLSYVELLKVIQELSNSAPCAIQDNSVDLTDLTNFIALHKYDPQPNPNVEIQDNSIDLGDTWQVRKSDGGHGFEQFKFAINGVYKIPKIIENYTKSSLLPLSISIGDVFMTETNKRTRPLFTPFTLVYNGLEYNIWTDHNYENYWFDNGKACAKGPDLVFKDEKTEYVSESAANRAVSQLSTGNCTTVSNKSDSFDLLSDSLSKGLLAYPNPAAVEYDIKEQATQASKPKKKQKTTSKSANKPTKKSPKKPSKKK